MIEGLMQIYSGNEFLIIFGLGLNGIAFLTTIALTHYNWSVFWKKRKRVNILSKKGVEV